MPINIHKLGKPWDSNNNKRQHGRKRQIKEKIVEHIRQGKGNETNRSKIEDCETMSRHNESKTEMKSWLKTKKEKWALIPALGIHFAWKWPYT